MRTKKHLITLLVLAATFFAGCETTHKAPPPKPTGQIIDIKFQNVRPKSAMLLFDLEIENPYAVSLPLTNLNYRLTSGDNTFLSGIANLQTAISPSSKEIVSLPVKVNYIEMLNSLKDVTPGSTIPYKAQLTLTADTPPFGLIELPLENEAELLLPTIPKPKKEVQKLRTPDVVFVPTPQEVVDKMLELTQVKKDDLLYDLGCGDGRIVVTAAQKYGCKAIGYDIDPQRIKESLENVEKSNVGNLVTIEQKDIFTLDLSKANVITLYLLPSLNVKLIPQLDKLKPGSRIVSHDFAMEGVTPDQVIDITSSDDNVEHKIYLWTAPLKKEKADAPAPVPAVSP
jgi:LEA14-like dessication related protein/precorrin-6B methylase 2